MTGLSATDRRPGVLTRIGHASFAGVPAGGVAVDAELVGDDLYLDAGADRLGSGVLHRIVGLGERVGGTSAGREPLAEVREGFVRGHAKSMPHRQCIGLALRWHRCNTCSALVTNWENANMQSSDPRRRAMLAVCSAAGGDVDAAREVLEALGLVEPSTQAERAAQQRHAELELAAQRDWMLAHGYLRPA